MELAAIDGHSFDLILVAVSHGLFSYSHSE